MRGYLKRAVSYLLCLAMIFTLFMTGCGGGGGGGNAQQNAATTAAATTAAATTKAAETEAAKAAEETTAKAAETTAATTTRAAETTAAAAAEAAPEGSGMTAPGILPITTGSATLTIGINQAARCSDYKDNVYTKLVEAETGVNLEFDLFPTDGAESSQKLELMVSSNQALPDIIIGLGLNAASRESYGTQGYLIDHRGYFDTLAHFWTQQVDKWCTPEEKDNMIKLGLTSQGKLYAFPFFYCDPTDPQAYAMWINQDWLQKGGLDIPKTTDDLYNALVSFRDNDLNGNGKNDEIPLIGSKGWISDPIVLLMNAFIYYHPGYIFNVENGKLYAPFVRDEWRDGLRYIRKLASENLLNELSFTQSGTDERAMTDLTEDQDTYVGAFIAHPYLMFGLTNPKRYEFTYIPPVTGPGGVSYVPKDIPQSGYSTSITSSCKDPELAFRLLDAMCKENISITCRYGPEGEEWWYVDDPSKANKSIMGGPALYDSVNTLVNVAAHSGNWSSWATSMMPPTLFGACALPNYSDPVSAYHSDNWYGSVPTRNGKNPPQLVPSLNYTPDEVMEINEIKTTIDTYFKECATLFVTGVMDIETEWDRYVSEIESIGLAQYIKIAQQCYDRMNAL